MSKVSVIVPIYNSSKYLRECLDSIVNQTLDDIEIIAIDDCSSDNSYDILLEYASKYKNIKAFRTIKNIGVGAVRNMGIELSTSNYIGFVDGDDSICPNMYEAMYIGAINNNNPDVISCGIRFIYDDNMNLVNYDYLRKGILTNLINNPLQVYWESPSCCNKMFKKELIGDYRFLEDSSFEDIAFTYSLLFKSNNILDIPDNYYLYRKNINNSKSMLNFKPNDKIYDIFNVCDELDRQVLNSGNYIHYAKVLPLLQQVVCLQRLNEIKNWDMNDIRKKDFMKKFYDIICLKYGDLSKSDIALLSARSDVSLIEKQVN